MSLTYLSTRGSGRLLVILLLLKAVIIEITYNFSLTKQLSKLALPLSKEPLGVGVKFQNLMEKYWKKFLPDLLEMAYKS